MARICIGCGLGVGVGVTVAVGSGVGVGEGEGVLDEGSGVVLGSVSPWVTCGLATGAD
jgi:hypothetical protein